MVELSIRNRWRIARLRKFLGFKLSDLPNSSDYFGKRKDALRGHQAQ